MRNPFYHRQGISDPRHFYGRGGLVRSLFEMIGSSQSCAVVGERRIGKSSLLSYLGSAEAQKAHGLEPRNTLSAVLDFMALHTCSPEELWQEILESLDFGTDDPEVGKILHRALGLPGPGFGSFRRAMRKLKRKGLRVVLLCDEFELAVNNPKFDTRFFGALRSLAGSEGVVFVTASRSSLLELGQYQDEDVRQKVLGSPFFNIFAEFALGPFKDYETAEMLAGLLDPTTVRLSRADVEFLDQIAGRHPYFLQLSAYHLYEELRRVGLGSRPRESRNRPHPPELKRQLGKCHAAVRERVRQESAKIFRNQWQHSCAAEARALAALAAKEGSEPQGQAARPGVLEPRILANLERRGLVKEVRQASYRRGRYRDTTHGSRRFRLFSQLLSEWIVAQVTLPALSNAAGQNEVSLPRLEMAGAESAVPERYSVIEEVGRGGTGTVFKAWDQRLERLVAIKVLDHQIRDSPGLLEALLVEARTCAALHHPNIVTIYDIHTEAGCLVQEFLAGGSLRDLLELMPVLPLPDVLTLAEQLAAALESAHRAGVVHRDLKPENVLLSVRPPLRASAGEVPILPAMKLADFGTALRFDGIDGLAARRSVAGTLAYMAPEQLAGEETGPGADFYSLGLMLREAMTGLPPRRPGSAGRDEVKLPPGVDSLVARCLARHPKDRFASADQLLVALEQLRRERELDAI